MTQRAHVKAKSYSLFSLDLSVKGATGDFISVLSLNVIKHIIHPSCDCFSYGRIGPKEDNIEVKQ